jgi:hypothetical protein
VFHTNSLVWLFNLPLDLRIFMTKLPPRIHRLHLSTRQAIPSTHSRETPLLCDGTSPTLRSTSQRAAGRARRHSSASCRNITRMAAASTPLSRRPVEPAARSSSNSSNSLDVALLPPTSRSRSLDAALPLTSSPAPTSKSRSVNVARPPPSNPPPPRQ